MSAGTPGGAAFTSDLWNPAANGWNLEAVQPAAAGFGALAFWMVLGRAMTGPLFSQSAWNNVTFTAGEVENPGRNLPRALLLGCLIVVALYITANIAYMVMFSLFPRSRTPRKTGVGTAMMQAIFGPTGAILMASRS